MMVFMAFFCIAMHVAAYAIVKQGVGKMVDSTTTMVLELSSNS
jgi:hypothetical protein